MARITTLLLALFAACASAPQEAEPEGPKIKRVNPLFVHPKIEIMLKNREHKVERTADGRLKVRMILMSTREKDLPIIVHAEWLDADALEVERSDPRTLVVGSFGSVVFEEESQSRAPVQVRVSVRPSQSAHLR